MNYSEYVDLSPDDPKWGHDYTSTKSGLRLHYVRKGRGKPVFLLHGWPGFWYDWRRIIPPLSNEADVLAPDYKDSAILANLKESLGRRTHGKYWHMTSNPS